MNNMIKKCVPSLLLMSVVLTHAVCADVAQPEEGFNALKAVFFVPAAFIQLIAYDIPRGIGTAFVPGANKAKKYEADLNSSDWVTRYTAVIEIEKKRKADLYPLLIRSLSDNQVVVALRAHDVLKQADRKTIVPLLINNLNSRDPWTRKLTVDILASLNDPEATKQLVFMANDDDPAVRLSALLALEQLSQENLLFNYYPVASASSPRDNITNWWYMRGKVIKKIKENQ